MLRSLIEATGKYGGIIYTINQISHNSLNWYDLLIGGGLFYIGVLADKSLHVKNLTTIYNNLPTRYNVDKKFEKVNKNIKSLKEEMYELHE
ncbi:hypothetical protein ACFL1H_01455 [Nanoarchaeota archaeon]